MQRAVLRAIGVRCGPRCMHRACRIDEEAAQEHCRSLRTASQQWQRRVQARRSACCSRHGAPSPLRVHILVIEEVAGLHA